MLGLLKPFNDDFLDQTGSNSIFFPCEISMYSDATRIKRKNPSIHPCCPLSPGGMNSHRYVCLMTEQPLTSAYYVLF